MTYNPYSKHRGPHPGIVATVLTVLFAASLALFFILSHGAIYPRPWGPPEAAQQVYLSFPVAIRWNAFLLFGMSVPLGIFTAAVTSRLSFLGVNVTGVSIALFGGISAAIFTGVSGMCTWTLSQSGIAGDLVVMYALQLLAFGSGGIAYTAGLGLLMAGVSIPCLFGKYTPRWLAWMGLILAGIAEVSTLSMVEPSLSILLPVVRFPAYVWMIGTGYTLARERKEFA